MLTIRSSGTSGAGLFVAAAILSDAYERVKERTAIELTHARIKIITDQQFSLVGLAVMLVQLLALLVVTVWVWLPLLVLELSNRCGASNEATVKRFCGAIVWVLRLDADRKSHLDAIFLWYRHHCWLVWFYRGGNTTLTVVMPHNADIEAEQKRSEWQTQEEGAPRGSTHDPGPDTLFEPPLLDVWDGWADMRSADDADFCLCLLLPPPGTPGMLSDINENNDAIKKKVGALEVKVAGLDDKVDGLDAKMDQVLRHLAKMDQVLRHVVVNHSDV